MAEHIEDLLSAYIDNELAEQERQHVENHLEKCSKCRAILRDFTEIQNQVVASFRSIEAPEMMEERVINAIRQTDNRPARKTMWLFVPLICTLCVMLAVVVFSGTIIFKFTSLTLKVIYNLIYALGSIVGTDPYVIAGLIGFSFILIITSGISLKRLLKMKTI